MLLAVLLFAWEEFYWRTSFILIPETLRCTVAMITKHGNESDRQYCFHSNVEVKLCVGKQRAWDDPILAEMVENIATLSPECRTDFVFGTTQNCFQIWAWTIWFCGNQNQRFWIKIMTPSFTRGLISQKDLTITVEVLFNTLKTAVLMDKRKFLNNVITYKAI